MIELLDAATIAARARTLSARISENQETIENIERLNGDTLFIKRWQDLPRTARPGSLQQAYKRTFGTQCNMPIEHRPDFEAINQWAGMSKTERRQTEKVFAMPYVNVENLISDTETLLAFIYTRSTYFPHVFMLLDLANANISIDGHEDGSDETLKSMSMVFGRTSGDYAALAPAGGLEAGEVKCSPFVGLAILVIQDQIYMFLKDIVAVLLSQCPMPGPGTVFPSKPDPTVDIDWPSMSTLARRATYEPWDAIELEYLSTMAGAHRTKALGHLLKMRENPEYFKKALSDWGQHVLTPTHRKDENDISEMDKWAHVSTLMIQEAYFLAEKWNGITNLLLQLTKSLDLYYAAWNTFKDAEVYSDALAGALHMRTAEKASLFDDLFSLLESTLVAVIDNYISLGLPGSPAMRTALKPTDSDSENGRAAKFHISDVVLKKNASRGKKKAFRLFQTLCTAEERHLYGPRNLTTEIQRLLDSDAEISFKHNVSPWIQDQFAEVALIVEIASQISLHPDIGDERRNERNHGANGDETAEVADGSALESNFIDQIREYCENEPVDPDSAALEYPIQDRQTTCSLDTMVRTERKVIDFWEGLDGKLGMNDSARGYGGKMAPIFQELMASKHFLSHPSQSWYYAGPESQSDGVTASMERVSLASTTTGEQPSIFPPQTAAVKVKTRPDNPIAEPVPDEPPRPQAPVARSLISLRRKDYEIFQVLFSERREGSLSWAEFCRAMVGAGFSMVPTFGGSAWAFSKDGLGAIHFHDPHEAKIGRFKLLAMAGDLRSAFGWNLESFVME